MKVYRVQDIYGCGPYTDCKLNKLLSHHMGNKHFPSIVEDIEHFDCDSHVCGFTSLKKLYEWFGHAFMDTAKESGFFIACYEIDSKHVRFGVSKKQVAFDPELAYSECRVEDD